MMETLIVISIFGLVASAVIHFSTLFNIYIPPRELIILINIGMIAALYPACMISRKVRNECGIKDSKKTLFNACPKWLRIMNGFFIMYALAGFAYFFFTKQYEGIAITHNSRGFTGYWMALYSTALVILYSCKRLKNKQNDLWDEKS